MDLKNNFWKDFFNHFTSECKKLYQNKGFNYDIPKEDQIRSSLYSFLTNKELLVEVESNIYVKNPKKHQATPRFDLRVLNKDFDLIIEIKRTTALNIWTNDFRNYLSSWQFDIDKLESLDNTEDFDKGNIKDKTRKCFLLFIFTNHDEKSQQLLEKLNGRIISFKNYVKEKWIDYDFYETEYVSFGNYSSASSNHELKAKMLVWWK